MNCNVRKLTLLITTISMKLYQKDTNVIHLTQCPQKELLHHC